MTLAGLLRLRKLTMVGIAAAFGKGTVLQVLIVGLLTFGWSSLQSHYRPYRATLRALPIVY